MMSCRKAVSGQLFVTAAAAGGSIIIYNSGDGTIDNGRVPEFIIPCEDGGLLDHFYVVKSWTQ
jgi:hypothetical protein